MLLRKTRAESVARVLPDLLNTVADAQSLAAADPERIADIIRPLGLQHIRARALVRAAQEILDRHGGEVPRSYQALLELPHAGRYVANATLIFAFSQERPLVDANIVRVFHRLFHTEQPVEVHKADALWTLAADLVRGQAPKHFWWAALDHAALICISSTPRCAACPVLHVCPSGITASQPQGRDPIAPAE